MTTQADTHRRFHYPAPTSMSAQLALYTTMVDLAERIVEVRALTAAADERTAELALDHLTDLTYQYDTAALRYLRAVELHQ